MQSDRMNRKLNSIDDRLCAHLRGARTHERSAERTTECRRDIAGQRFESRNGGSRAIENALDGCHLHTIEPTWNDEAERVEVQRDVERESMNGNPPVHVHAER